jgi:uncharacterized membrane protein
MSTKVRLSVIVFLVVVALATLFIRIPLPTGGYFNFGDVVVVFAGLTVGVLAARRQWLLGMVIGGLGSAAADVIGGYALFAPITLVAKGLEGMLAALASNRKPIPQFGILIIGGAAMVGTYFVGEWLMPSVGLAGAITELIPNTIQAVGGIVGGYILHRVYTLVA